MTNTRASFLAILSIFIFISSSVNAEPLGIDLKETLRIAITVTPAKIIAYDADGFKFQPTDNTKVLSARYSAYDSTWVPTHLIRQDWPPKDKEVILSSQWPPVGSNVLIVVDEKNVVSLFAWSFGGSHRFWSPTMTGSVAIFYCKPLGEPIHLLFPDAANPTDDPEVSLDGCLVDKSMVSTKIADMPGTSGKSFVIILLIFVAATWYLVTQKQQKS